LILHSIVAWRFVVSRTQKSLNIRRNTVWPITDTNHKIMAGETYFKPYVEKGWAGLRSRYSDCLRAGRSGDRIPVVARFSSRVQNGPEAHAAPCTMGTGYFPGLRCGRGVTLTPHPLLVPRSKIE
jgi:hypothetical protein